MSIKTKLISLVMTFVLLTSLLTVGVFAVKNTSFNVGGNIVFNAQGIEAEVKLEALNNGSLIAPQTLANKMLTFELNNDMTESQVLACYESWADLDLQFDSEEDVTLQIRITNTTEIADNLLKVDMSTTFGSANNCTISVDKATATINPGEYEIFTITFSITNKEYSANIENFGINVNMSQVEPFKVNMEYDEENNYYYIEMGTYNNKPVRWRYVSDVTNGIDTAVRFAPSSTNTPVSTEGSKGMFILESEIFIADTLKDSKNNVALKDLNDGIVQFLQSNLFDTKTNKHTTEKYTDINANDYAASDLRAFLNGRMNVANQDVGNLMNVINIDNNNSIYQKIQGRTLADLYSGIAVSDEMTYTAVHGNLPEQFNGTTIDRFWSLSANEAYKILGGNDISGNELCWESPAFVELMQWAGFDEGSFYSPYWLRSGSNDYLYGCYSVSTYGDMGLCEIYSNPVAVRPAFILEF